MGVENVMYFALGLLVSGLVALVIMPAVWRRAVRLTKKRIEAATPITMAEFRADKDQLRAEFALSTRRLEMNVEALRRRLSDQLRDINQKRTEVGAMREERNAQLAVIRELEEREAELRRRIVELEKETAEANQRLLVREREFSEKSAQLEQAREALRARPTMAPEVHTALRDSATELGSLKERLELAQRRADALEAQNRSLLGHLQGSDRRTADATSAVTELRASLARKEVAEETAQQDLVEAERRAAEAEQRVTTTLLDTSKHVERAEEANGQLLAEKLAMEDELARLRGNVHSVENSILADWETERLNQGQLREKLNDIASTVGRLVRSVDGEASEPEQSLFDRVQRFSDIDEPVPGSGRRPEPVGNAAGVSDRLAALRDVFNRRP